MDIKSTSSKVPDYGASEANEASEKVLTGVANGSIWLEKEMNGLSETLGGILTNRAVDIADYDQAVWDKKLNMISKDSGIDIGTLDARAPKHIKPGRLSKGFGLVGTAQDIVSGLADMGRGILHDQATGDKDYTSTLAATGKTTLKIGAVGLAVKAGFGVAAAVGTVAGSSVILPAAIGLGVGLGANYLASEAVDYVTDRVDIKAGLTALKDAAAEGVRNLKFW